MTKGSTLSHCTECLQRQASQGTRHDYHSAITPVIVKPDSPDVLPLRVSPGRELMVPQAGHEKQACERAAVKRWLAPHAQPDSAWPMPYLGDDLAANQPRCQQIADTTNNFLSWSVNPIRRPRATQKAAYSRKWRV